jgi:hypothetical protein
MALADLFPAWCLSFLILFGVMFNDLHAPLIDTATATRLFTLQTIALVSEFVKRRLFMFGVLLWHILLL